MLKNIRTLGKTYSNHLIAVPLLIWIGLLFVPGQYLGDNYALRNAYMLQVLPVIGWLCLGLGLICRSIKYLIFGLLFIFAFWVTMGLGYLLLGA
ncbi:hypothetical protein ABID29_002356 [Streptococcus rupicaprae]|uniref:SpeK n=1 Tax=Streptococcus rupicaprae TaxID=759619 RepID=A0ABV2FL03_9STRE